MRFCFSALCGLTLAGLLVSVPSSVEARESSIEVYDASALSDVQAELAEQEAHRNSVRHRRHQKARHAAAAESDSDLSFTLEYLQKEIDALKVRVDTLEIQQPATDDEVAVIDSAEADCSPQTEFRGDTWELDALKKALGDPNAFVLAAAHASCNSQTAVQVDKIVISIVTSFLSVFTHLNAGVLRIDLNAVYLINQTPATIKTKLQNEIRRIYKSNSK